MDKSHVTERILSLTLEIIYLLTGEGYTVVNKSSAQVTPGSHPHLPGRTTRINSKKILEVTNKIIELLTGEVPIRCQDVTVYFSMEEWEYLEGHKDLYEDVVVEHPKLFTSRDTSDDLKTHTVCFSEHPISGLCKPKTKNCADKLAEAPNLGQHEATTAPKCTQFTQTELEHSREGSPCIEDDDVIYSTAEEPVAGCITEMPEPLDEPNGSDDDDDDCLMTIESEMESNAVISHSHPSTAQKSAEGNDRQAVWHPNCVASYKKSHTALNHAEIEYPSNCIIEVPSLCPEGSVNHMDIYAASDGRPGPYRSAQTSEEPKNVIFSNVFTPADLTQDELTSIKQELVTWEEESLSFQEIYLPVKHIQESTAGGALASRSNNLHVNFGATHVKMEREEVDNEEGYEPQEQAQEAFVDVCIEEDSKDSISSETLGTTQTLLNYAKYGESFNSELGYATPPMYNCPDCKRSFSNSSNLAKHQLLCRGRKPHVCSGCGKCFASASYLVIHERIHTGERPFSCSHCGKSFSRKPDLVRHERIHTGERPFACPDCGKRFTSVSNIFMHRRIHTGVKPFPCSQCGKRFIKKSDLVRHEKIHLPQRPLPCPECGQLFASNHILNKHMLSHAGRMQVAFQGGS